MARKKANYPLIEGLEITTLAAEGKAMGRYNDVVVFVPMTVPGDVVDVQIRSKRRRYMEGFVVNYVKRSPLREEPFCAHFGVCGGCKWQNLPYAEQLRFKTDQVRDQLARIGKVELPEIAPCLPSAETRFYRNKLEFTFAERRWLTYEEIAEKGEIADAPALGFHIPGMFDKVLDIEKCWLQPDPSNAIREETRRFCLEHGYTFHNPREHRGLMRNMVVRTASTGEVMAIVVFGEEDTPRIEALMSHVAERFPQITSLFYVVNTKWIDSLPCLTISRPRFTILRHCPTQSSKSSTTPPATWNPSATGARITSSSGWRGCSSRSAPSRSIRPIRRRRTNFTRSRATSPP